MGENLKSLLIFVAGAAVGAVATWKFVENKYKAIADEEIESVKEAFSKRHKELDDYEKNLNTKEELKIAREKTDKTEKPNIVEYSSMVNNLGYTANSDQVTGRTIHEDGPYVIDEDEFDLFDDYNTVSLFYCADGFLMDEDDNLIDNIDEIVGYDSLDAFSDEETDSVYVRNDIKKTDYEILRSAKYYYGDVIPNEEE